MLSATSRLPRGALWPAILRQTDHAIGSGALHSIETEQTFVEQDGVRFLVRLASNIIRKERDKKIQARRAQQTGTRYNPFLPPEKDLTVADISATHLAVLNKFNVVDHHLLVVTRTFADQDTLLTQEDFAALWIAMAEYPSLGFYNGGRVAGASQQHKHLQVVPLPLTKQGPALPIEPLLVSEQAPGNMVENSMLPFRHAFTWLDPMLGKDPAIAGPTAFALYRQMLASVSITPLRVRDQVQHSTPYNLLVTERWMLLVPRSVEHFGPISVNSLGFAGSLFVRNEQELELVKAHGPMTILQSVTLPAA